MARRRLPGTDPGQYDQRVTIYKRPSSPTVNADGQDEDPDAKTLVARRWASVLPVTGAGRTRTGERTMAGQTQADVTHEVRMHSDSLTRTFTPAMWLTLPDGTRLDIESVIDVGLRRVEVQLDCNERV
jgi:head-tail adaptor